MVSSILTPAARRTISNFQSEETNRPCPFIKTRSCRFNCRIFVGTQVTCRFNRPCPFIKKFLCTRLVDPYSSWKIFGIQAWNFWTPGGSVWCNFFIIWDRGVRKKLKIRIILWKPFSKIQWRSRCAGANRGRAGKMDHLTLRTCNFGSLRPIWTNKTPMERKYSQI